MSFFSELKRRNMFKVAMAYLALGWVVVEVTDMAVPALNLSPASQWYRILPRGDRLSVRAHIHLGVRTHTGRYQEII